MYKIILFLLFVSTSIPCFADMNSTNYNISNDFFCAGASIGLSSTNYSVNDILGNGSGVASGSITSTDYDIEGGPHSFTENTVWYLAEGSTLNSPRQFYEWITIQNPSPFAATDVRLTFMDPSGNTVQTTTNIGIQTRFTLDVASYMPDSEVSTVIESISGVPIFVERPMYWDSGGITYAGGHVATGVTEPATTWYLAEGTTQNSPRQYYEWITIQNPSTTTIADVTLTFMDGGGNTVQTNTTVGTQSRKTINAADHMPNSNEVSTTVESTNGVLIIVERPMYWDSGGIDYVGGHVAPGVTSSALTWYLAEGTTQNSPRQYYEWITIQNPSTTSIADVTLTFMDGGGNTVQTNTTVGAQSRRTINAADHMPNSNEVSATVESTNSVPIIVERPMYWDSGGITYVGGHNTTGVTSAATTWNLAEGTTQNSPRQYYEWITIQNPSTTNIADVTITFMDGSGNTVQANTTVGTQSRRTINAADYMPNSNEVSATVESTNSVPIIVERPMYWDSGGITYVGGHDTAGVPQ